jgi:hypothetical protein
MGSQERKAIIEAPIKAILTDAGTTFFMNNKKALKKFRLSDQSEEYGFLLDRFSPASLQRMILIDYIAKIDISVKEFASIRQEVMDICKLLTYSMLYRQFDAQVFQRILANEVVKNWNRRNPGNIIDEKTIINTTLHGMVQQDRDKMLASIKQSILAPMHAYISKSSKLMPEEKNIQLLLSEKFLNTIRPFIWLIMAKFQENSNYESLVKEVRTGLMEYMEKSRIAEYIALNVIDLASNAENSNLKREAKAFFMGEVDMNAVLFDAKIRRQVQDSLHKRGELVSISWKLGSRGPSSGMGRLEITINNKESNFDMAKDLMTETRNPYKKSRSLMDYYKNEPPGEANTELGLYYLSYLSEACEKVHVKLETLFNHVPESDMTIASLTLHL